MILWGRSAGISNPQMFASEHLKMIAGHSTQAAVPGVVLGAVVTLGAGKLFVSLVYGVKSSDPLTFFGIAALLVGVASLAMYIPVRRAAGIDPTLALRSE